MEPVRILRRNCSILHVSDKDGHTIVMRPNQMLKYIVNINELKAKLQLQNIVSRLKKCTRFSIGNHKQSPSMARETLDFCRNVLEWAKNYENEPTMYAFHLCY